MKTNIQTKPRVNSQQVTFELKQNVILALNKLSDRDTCQIGIDELEKLAECVPPNSMPSFLSCLLDTDKEQKTAVRRECVRLMGVLVTFHDTLLVPHLCKMVGSVVKRLKDPDSVVRDACVESMGVFASKLSGHGDVFVAMVRPLFEALGEQNRQVQSGSALCLAMVIDNACDPPVAILQRMLVRTMKLLKNPHFMAKAAVVGLSRSIILAGGAPSHSILSAAITSIQESLRNSDWTTRKAAAVALAEIASSGLSRLGSFKLSCLHSLESCRFDKVKPVRDAVLHALQYWKNLRGSDSHEPSETGSSVKENFCSDYYSDFNGTNDSLLKDGMLNRVLGSANKKIPLSVKRTFQNHVDFQHSKADEWQIEIAVPKTQVSLGSVHDEESQDSSATKTFETLATDATSAQYTGCEYVPMDEKQESSSVANLVHDNFESKSTRTSNKLNEGDGLPKTMGCEKQPARINNDEQVYYLRMQDRRSLDSTVTESSCQISHGSSYVVNEMACIRKQLLEIESKQSNLIELLQVFSAGITDSLSVLQSKVSGLEYEIDRIGQFLVRGARHSDSAISKLIKKNQTAFSPRLSACTPRPTVDIHNRQPLILPGKKVDVCEEKPIIRSKALHDSKQGTEMETTPTIKSIRNTSGKEMQKSYGKPARSFNWTTKTDFVFSTVSGSNNRQNGALNKNCLWQNVKGLLCEGDLESAYMEALCSGNELVLIELLERTGPVLEKLSHKTRNEILSTLASYLLEQRFLNFVLPWLEQVVALSRTHAPDDVVPSAKARRELLSAIQEAMAMEFSSYAERRSVIHLATSFRQLWQECMTIRPH